MAELPEDSGDNLNRFRFRNYTSERTPNFIKWLPGAALVVVALLILLVIGRQIHHHYVNKPTVPASAAGSAPHAPTGQAKASPNKPSKHSPNSSGQAVATAGKGSGQLANTGPGNTLAVFASASILAGGTHFVIASRRRQAS